MKPSIARAIALKTLEGGITPFLLGGTGVGKSAVVLDIANELAGNRKLSVDNLSNLYPHPFYTFLHYSHPPLLHRLEALSE